MQIREIMTAQPEFLLSTATIAEAAKKMRDLDTGFLPIGDKKTDKIVGTLTDRDIVIGALANNKTNASVNDVMHAGVCYCFEDDDVQKAAKKMKSEQIRRLIVLNKNKRLTGVVSLGDISLCCDKGLSGETLEGISEH